MYYVEKSFFVEDVKSYDPGKVSQSTREIQQPNMNANSAYCRT